MEVVDAIVIILAPSVSTSLPASADELSHIHFTDGLMEGSFCSFSLLGLACIPDDHRIFLILPPMYLTIPRDPNALRAWDIACWFELLHKVENAEYRAKAK